MKAALAYLVFTSSKNRVLTRLRRLRQPKYLIGLLVGGLYFFSIFLHWFTVPGRAGRAQPGGMPASVFDPQLVENIGACVLCVIALLAWIIPHERAALTFSEAEIAFLFPAPVKRRTLIHFKLLKSQIGILYTSLIFTLVSVIIGAVSRHSLNIGAAWIRALSWWSIFSTVNLHFLASSFARTMLLEHGISNRIRRIAIFAIVLTAAATVIIWAARAIPGFNLAGVTRLEDVTDYVTQVLSAGPLPYILYPFRLVVRPYLSHNGAEFVRAFGPALAILLVHYWWVVRSNVAFEETSVEASQKMAERIATIRANRGQFTSKPKKKKQPPFRLRPTGAPAIGLLWKNLIGAGQAFTFRFWFVCIWMAFLAVVITSIHGKVFNFGVFLGMMSLIFLAMSFFFGPQLVRQDFRQDLVMADVLKTYPMSGSQMALGELLAPALILTAVQWLLIILATGLTANLGNPVPIKLRLAAASGLGVVAPALDVLILIIPNAAVLMFPGWFQTGKDSPQGIEVMGQRLIFAFGQFVVLLLALIPGGLAFGITYWVSQMFVGYYLAVPVASTAVTLVLALEAWLGLLGTRPPLRTLRPDRAIRHSATRNYFPAVELVATASGRARNSTNWLFASVNTTSTALGSMLKE
jgi:hypothetical protein